MPLIRYFDVRQEGCSGLSRSYVDEPTAILTLGKHHYTINQSVDSVILAHTHVFTRVVNCATLTLDNVAGLCILTAKNLNTESFAF